MSQIRVGILGLGRSGYGIHCAELSRLPEMYRLVHVCDCDCARAREVGGEYGCRWSDSPFHLFADAGVDLVVVASPSHLHRTQSLRGLLSGRHVVCDKPLLSSVADVLEMRRVAEDHGKVFTVYQNRRYDADFCYIRDMISSGVLGRISHIRIWYSDYGCRTDWQALRSHGGGILSNAGSHFIDQGLVLYGDGDPEVFCRRDRVLTGGDAEDHVKLIMHGAGRPMIELELSNACSFKVTPWRVIGTRGCLKSDSELATWNIIPEDIAAPEPSAGPAKGRKYGMYKPHEIWHQHRYERTHCRFYEDLYECIRGGDPAPVSGADILRQARVLEKCSPPLTACH